MKIFSAFFALASSLVASAVLAADIPPGAWLRGPPAKSPIEQKGPLALPPLALQPLAPPLARPFVQNPAWRRAVRVGHRPALHFRYHRTVYVVLGGPYFIQPASYAFVSTPYFPATFYDPNNPDAGYNLFYCPSPAGYYPDVQDCPAGWWSTAPDAAPEVDPGY